jgi:hypothetical protein
VCADPIRVRSGHRARTYCSGACRSAAYRRRTRGHNTRGLIRLVQGDALGLLKEMTSESVDLIVTDPPYQFAHGTTYFRTWFAMLPDSVWPEVCQEFHGVLRPDRHLGDVSGFRVAVVAIEATTATRNVTGWGRGFVTPASSWGVRARDKQDRTLAGGAVNVRRLFAAAGRRGARSR